MKIEHPFMNEILEVKKTIDELKSIILNNHVSKPVYQSEEFNELMGICNTTAKAWRKDGKIRYSMVGNKIYYSVDDIRKLLDNHYIPIKKKV